VRLAVFTVALLFIAALGVLTARDIRVHGATPVDVVAVVILVLFTTGIVGALLHPPRR
jgi:VIT1/CCC1 family predicted Fe2+/Mn2+ transporter